jgi:hypothetical protein
MTEYLVSRTFVLNQLAALRPSGPAISALQAANSQLEMLMPRQQQVPAYQPATVDVDTHDRAKSGD